MSYHSDDNSFLNDATRREAEEAGRRHRESGASTHNLTKPNNTSDAAWDSFKSAATSK